MTRDAYADRLLDLAYGELRGREAREVEDHAATCEACRAELARIRGTRRVMAALPDEPAPERGERILVAAAREAAEARRPRRLAPRWLLGGAIVAASLAVVAAVSLRVSPWTSRRDERNGLLGASPDARPPPAAGDAVASSAPAAATAPGVAERKSETQRRAYASPPPAAPAPATPSRAAAARPRAAEAEEAPPSFAVAERSAGAAPRAAAPSAAPAPAMAAPSRARAAAKRESFGAPAGAGAEPAADGAPVPAGVRRFPGCEGEAVRRVEVDASGRVVRYVREGRVDGRRLRIVHAFGPDGRPAGVTVDDLDAPGAALDAGALGLSLPARAEDAGLDAPPRCGR